MKDRLKGVMFVHKSEVSNLQQSMSWKSRRISFFLVLVFLVADLGVLANESESPYSSKRLLSIQSQFWLTVYRH